MKKVIYIGITIIAVLAGLALLMPDSNEDDFKKEYIGLDQPKIYNTEYEAYAISEKLVQDTLKADNLTFKAYQNATIRHNSDGSFTIFSEAYQPSETGVNEIIKYTCKIECLSKDCKQYDLQILATD